MPGLEAATALPSARDRRFRLMMSGSVTSHSKPRDAFGGSGRAASLRQRYAEVRAFTVRLCEPLETEDFVVQSAAEVSPPRWHLAHMTWFFETFILARFDSDYKLFDPRFSHLFNSYYNTIGEQFPRPRRGVLSRPTVRQVLDFREQVDHAMDRLLAGADHGPAELLDLVEIGLQHEQQHQELLIMDVKHNFFCNPLEPVYRPVPGNEGVSKASSDKSDWVEFEEGLYEIGFDGEGFAYDNELPRHRVFVERFELADRLVTNGEFAAFVEDGGYDRHDLWLSDAWTLLQSERWRAPLYWLRRDGAWHEFTLGGAVPLDPRLPVSHLSYFEAEAFARWKGCRLPTEAEWEVAVADRPVAGNFVESERFQPAVAPAGAGLRQMFGDLWEWTASQYVAYPGYRPPAGALGEYNGKFMCNQFVLRGGSCATPQLHVRATYRNFYPPAARWQFAGLRLAR